MSISINFTGRSNTYFAITKKGWGNKIPDKAYKQIDDNRKAFEKFARKNNIKITFTDANNMLPEFHTGSESSFLSGKLAIEVENKQSFISKIKTKFSNLKDKITNKSSVEVITTPYYSKDSKKIPSLKEQGRVGFLIDYETGNTRFSKSINLETISDLLHKVVGKKSDKLLNLK